MTECIEKESGMVLEDAIFKWKISDFSTYNLLEGAIVSPLFKYFGREFRFEMSRSSEKIRLRLTQSDSGDSRRISYFHIGFCNSSTDAYYGKSYFAPEKHVDISCELSFAGLKTYCLANNMLTAKCVVQATQLKHTFNAQPVTPVVRDKKVSGNKGHATLAKSFGTILENPRFSDVALRVGEETFQAHKAILASRSRVFDGMFQSGMKENQENVVDVAEMKPTIVKEMLQYIYAGTIGELTMDTAIDLYVGSDRYDLQELKGWCKEFILEHISAHDVCRVAVIAHLHFDEELAMAAKHTFKENWKTIILSEMWRDFGEKNPTLQTEFFESILLSDD